LKQSNAFDFSNIVCHTSSCQKHNEKEEEATMNKHGFSKVHVFSDKKAKGVFVGRERARANPGHFPV
jgi:hypothetical protein